MNRTEALRLRDQQRLVGVHPDLAEKVLRILAAMDALGFAMTVTEGVRTAGRQAILYQQGRTTPGKIVTDKDGVINKSNHQVKGDGYGHAVDCAFLDDPTTARIETYDENQPWEVYGLMGEKLGLSWGGRWKQPHDMPHLERRA